MKIEAQFLRKLFAKELSELYTSTEINRIFFFILESLCGLSYTQYFTNPSTEIEAEKCIESLSRLKTGEPWQYVAGETDFLSLRLKVDHRVLIPRPETEELVLLVFEQLKNNPPLHILDVGTGSGAIALALKKLFPGSQVTAMDFSKEILELVEENARLNNLEIQIHHGDINKNEFPNKNFDLIVSNPPYVMESEKKFMQKNVLHFEPHRALFVPDNDPIVFYRKIIDFYNSSSKGLLFFELNPATAKKVGDYAKEINLRINFYPDSFKRLRFARINKSNEKQREDNA